VSKAKRQEERREVVAVLAKRFPKCFSIEAPRKPLKVGIHVDIMARLGNVIAPEQLRRGLAAYTGATAYLRGIVSGAIRRDLNGNAAGMVTEKEAAAAQAVMVRRRQPDPIQTETSVPAEIAPAESEIPSH
jgi:ProP effector